MGRDGEGDKKEVKGWEGKRFAGPMSNCFLRPCKRNWKKIPTKGSAALSIIGGDRAKLGCRCGS